MKIELLDPTVVVDQYCWLVRLGELQLGVDTLGAWCMQRQNGDVFYFDFPGSYVPLEPILELEPSELSTFLQRAAANHPLFGKAILNFPMLALVKHTFDSAYSDYWPTRALAWINAEKHILPYLREELERFENNKVMSQSARQQAKNLLKQA